MVLVEQPDGHSGGYDVLSGLHRPRLQHRAKEAGRLPWPERIGKAGADLFQRVRGGKRFQRTVDDAVQDADVIEPGDVIGMRVGVQDRVESPDAAGQELEAHVGRRIHQQPACPCSPGKFPRLFRLGRFDHDAGARAPIARLRWVAQRPSCRSRPCRRALAPRRSRRSPAATTRINRLSGTGGGNWRWSARRAAAVSGRAVPPARRQYGRHAPARCACHAPARGKIRCVGLHQQSFERKVERDIPQFIGFWESQDTGKADISTELLSPNSASCRDELKQCSRKANSPPRIAFFLQDSGNVGISVAGMDRQRQAGQAGGTDMSAEIVLLHIPRRAVVEVVQAGFADADDLRMLGQRGERLRRRDLGLRGVVRMDPDGAPDIWRGFPPISVRWRTARWWCRWSPSRPPRPLGAGQHIGQFRRGVIIQVAVRIDQHRTMLQSGFRLPHNAGKRPGVAAAPCRRAAGRPASAILRASPGTPS